MLFLQIRVIETYRRNLAACKPNLWQYSRDGCPEDKQKVEIDLSAAYKAAGMHHSMSAGGAGTGESSAGVLIPGRETVQCVTAEGQ